MYCCCSYYILVTMFKMPLVTLETQNKLIISQPVPVTCIQHAKIWTRNIQETEQILFICKSGPQQQHRDLIISFIDYSEGVLQPWLVVI